MKLRLAILLPAFGLGGGYRKYVTYAQHMDRSLCDVFLLTLDKTNLSALPRGTQHVSFEELLSFVQTKQIQYVYCGATLSNAQLSLLGKYTTLLFNVNFLPNYDVPRRKSLYFVMSQTVQYKIVLAKKAFRHALKVVYNPIPVEKWIKYLDKKSLGQRQTTSELVVGRLARAEPSKWDFLIISTLFMLQFDSNKKSRPVRFLFAGAPLLYRFAIRVFCPFAKVSFLPQLKSDTDIASFYNSIDLFWQASSAGETFGNVIAESYCFSRPVLSDSKHFVDSFGRIKKHVDNAQIELVDNNMTGIIFNYPSHISHFFKTVSKKELERMGKNGQKKVAQFDAKTSCNTLLKYLYIDARDYGFPKTPTFEKISLFPKTQGLDFSKEYLSRIKEIKSKDAVGFIERTIYALTRSVWSVIEFLYLIIRKLLRIVHMDIEYYKPRL